MPDFPQARDCLSLWKSDEYRDYARRLTRRALELLDAGVDYIGSDDVEPGAISRGVPGSVICAMRNGHVLADYWGSRPEAGIVHGRRKSKRAERNGAKVSLYTLTSRAAAETLLRRLGADVTPQQGELRL
jgi:hypothetical protein